MLRIAVLLLVSLVSAPALAQPTAEASQLEARLIAPCCWAESLAHHDSPLAHELRAEIEQRLARGETIDAVESDLVSRYGERLRAIPHGVENVSAWLLVLVALLGLQLVLAARRWRDRGRQRVELAPGGMAPAALPDALDARLDRALEAFDEL